MPNVLTKLFSNVIESNATHESKVFDVNELKIERNVYLCMPNLVSLIHICSTKFFYVVIHIRIYKIVVFIQFICQRNLNDQNAFLSCSVSSIESHVIKLLVKVVSIEQTGEGAALNLSEKLIVEIIPGTQTC